MRKDAIPESQSEKESLTSSSTLPTFKDIEAEYAEILSGVEEEKPKRGKKAKPETEDEEIIKEQIEPDDIEDTICFPLNAWFRRNDKEQLSSIERRSFALATSRLINKYLPIMGNKWKEEVGFVICVGTIFAIRYKFEQDGESEPEPAGKE